MTGTTDVKVARLEVQMTDTKVQLGKIETKVDSVIVKIDSINMVQSEIINLKDEIKNLKATIALNARKDNLTKWVYPTISAVVSLVFGYLALYALKIIQ